MKTFIFQTEKQYLEWESKKDNCIYALQDMQGRYIGDIREKDLLPLWDEGRITSFDNPKNKADEIFQDENIINGGFNWSITNDNDKEIWSKLVKIEILNK